MADTQHTKEPWRANHANAGDRGYEVAGGDKFLTQVCDDVREVNAHRIVACVNACAGISTENLETLPGYSAAIDGFHEQRDLVVKARNQRDELLEALRFMVANIGQPRCTETAEGFAAAEAAIAKAEAK
jgi:hypothetical protein